MTKRQADIRALRAWRQAGKLLRARLYDVDPESRRVIVAALLADARTAVDENDEDDELGRELARSRKEVHDQNIGEVRSQIDRIIAGGSRDEA